MTSTPYLIPRQREISKTKWQPLYTLKKQHQQNRLCVDLNTLSLNFTLLFLYIRYSIDRTITYYFKYVMLSKQRKISKLSLKIKSTLLEK